MKTPFVFLLSSFVLSAGPLAAQLYLYDGFSSADYTAGSTVNGLGGGSGWDGNWSVDTSGNANNIHRYWGTDYSLNYTDGHGNSLVTSPGGLQLRSAGSGAGFMTRPFDAPAQGEVWFSFLNIRTSNQTFNYDLQFLDANGVVQFRVQNDGSGNFFRINQASGSTATLNLQNHDMVSQEPLGQLFIGRVTNVGSGENNATITVWVNPNNLLDLSEGAAAMNSLSGRTVDAVTQFTFAKGAATTGYFDEFRVGGSFADVAPIPEPRVYALMAGVLFLGLAGLRRLRR